MADLMSLAKQWLVCDRDHSAGSRARVDNVCKCSRINREITPFNRVVDFGCGIGGWLAAAQLLGAAEVKSYDGPWVSQASTTIPKELMNVANLAEDVLDFEKRFDLAIRIEVAEHLPENADDNFVKILV